MKIESIKTMMVIKCKFWLNQTINKWRPQKNSQMCDQVKNYDKILQ